MFSLAHTRSWQPTSLGLDRECFFCSPARVFFGAFARQTASSLVSYSRWPTINSRSNTLTDIPALVLPNLIYLSVERFSVFVLSHIPLTQCVDKPLYSSFPPSLRELRLVNHILITHNQLLDLLAHLPYLEYCEFRSRMADKQLEECPVGV